MSTTPISNDTIRQWIETKLDTESVRLELSRLGYDEESSEIHLREFRKQKYAGRQKTGLILLAAGAITGFLSCVLTLLNPAPALHDLFLFGLTSVAIVVICWGLYLVFE